MKEKFTKRDIYQEVTNRIVAELERGCAPWVKPWADGGSTTDIPINGHSKRAYRGVNTFLLWLTQAVSGFESREWFTFNQALRAGGQVRRGEKATMVVFWKQIEIEDDEPEEPGTTTTVPVLRYYNVFNRDQIDGLSDALPRSEPEWNPVERAEALVGVSGATLQHGGDRACYMPSLDVIKLPRRRAFTKGGDYYATLLHELTHWTGHPNRLARVYGRRFGDTAYAREELVAEMGAAFLCASVHITGRLQHPEYINHWLSVLREDKRAVFTAASHAQKAADYLLGKLEESVDAGGPECGHNVIDTDDCHCTASSPELKEAS